MNISTIVWLNIILSCLIFGLFTTTNALAESDPKPSLFNSKPASLKLRAIKKRINANPKDLELKKDAVSKIEALQNKANTCIKKANNQLTTLNNVLKSLQSLDEQTDIHKIEDFKYFENQKTLHIKQAISCQKFIFQSEEILSELNESIQKITTQIKLYRATPIWTILSMVPKLTATFDTQKFYQSSGISPFTISSSIILFVIILASLLLAIFIRKRCSDFLDRKKEKKKYSVELATTLKKYIIPLLLFGNTSLYLTILFNYIEPKPMLENICYIILTYLVAIAILDFSSLAPETSGEDFPHKNRKRFFARTIALLTTIAAITIFAVFISFQNTAVQFKYTVISYFYFLLGIIITWKNWPIISTFISKSFHTKFSTYLKYTIITTLSAAFIIQALGYYQLSLHIIYGFLLIPLTIIIFYSIRKLLNSIEEYLNGRRGERSIRIRRSLGIKYNKKITEFVFIKISAYLLTIYLLILTLFDIFGLPSTYIDKLNKTFIDGFTLVNIKIIPVQIVLALLVFAITFIFGRWLTNIITKKRNLQKDSDIQNVMASLLSYINFCLSFIIAMIIAGVDFTGLTVIVGALSVGIGLGLQNVVNNFISGIILLVEKSIKPGDRVIINGKEGFVKEIRLRSTQITTLAKEDIIVPNSDFITQQVVNYTFRDELTRVACKVGVSYDSNVDLVQKTLLEIAEKHPDVKHDEANKPAVLFNEFADSSLNFTLYCTITDANKRYRVISDLNTTVFKEFKKLNIEIAFPQLDVHMK